MKTLREQLLAEKPFTAVSHERLREIYRYYQAVTSMFTPDPYILELAPTVEEDRAIRENWLKYRPGTYSLMSTTYALINETAPKDEGDDTGKRIEELERRLVEAERRADDAFAEGQSSAAPLVRIGQLAVKWYGASSGVDDHVALVDAVCDYLDAQKASKKAPAQ